ncbi:hypothetical protein ACWEVD_25125 [Nocardia thailandica]|uniref:Uncharacterized protein n=1 Tax=Nocardia thailandica TaxID=257275 RepID=A0ABW6PTE7_9NOCA
MVPMIRIRSCGRFTGSYVQVTFDLTAEISGGEETAAISPLIRGCAAADRTARRAAQ